MNKVILLGRLTRDPEVRYTQGNEPMAVARYSLAVDRQGKKDENKQNADFISCVAFGKRGEFAEKYLHDGTKRYTTDVVVDEHSFCESKGTTSEAQATDEDGFMNVPDGVEDDGLPFN